MACCGWVCSAETNPQGVSGSPARESITLQLQWHHQFQFAGYYAAKEKGFYAQEGLDVVILDGGYDANGNAKRPVEEVVFGRADFGVTRSDLLLHHSRGIPVTMLANIFQRSPFVLLSLKEYGIRRLTDIEDHPITLNIPEPGKSKRIDAETVAMLAAADIALQSLNNRMPSWNLQDLLDGTTYLMPAHRTDEPYFVTKAGRTPVILAPEDYGLDFYGDLLFTSTDRLRSSPDQVERFRRASIRGWKYALAHSEEIVDLILRDYATRGPRYDRAFLLYEAQAIRELMQPELVEVGYVNRERWKQIANTYLGLGLIKGFDLDSFLYAGPGHGEMLRWRYWMLGTLGTLLFATPFLLYLVNINRRLQREMERRHHVELELRLLSETDFLTGLANRRRFQQVLNEEFHRNRRHGSSLSVLMVDLDDFKQVNDRFGHSAGDRVLQEMARLVQQVLRLEDTFARIGGEEFGAILPETNQAEAISIAERIRDLISSQPAQVKGEAIPYTVSIGVAELGMQDASLDELLARTDQALYLAKSSGKNCVIADS